jgi:hypothetical protein
MVIENRGNVFISLAGVYHRRFAAIRCDCELSFEGESLGRTRSVVVMIVEASFADCNHARIADHDAEPIVGRWVPFAGSVRMDAGGDSEPRLGASQLKGPFCRRPTFADYHDPTNSGGPGSLHHE